MAWWKETNINQVAKKEEKPIVCKKCKQYFPPSKKMVFGIKQLKLWNCTVTVLQCYIVCMRSQDETGQYIKLSVIANIIQLLQISLVISSLIQIYRQISESLLIQLINKSEEEVKGVVKNSELPTSSRDHHYSCCLWAKNGALSDSHLYCHLPAYAPLLLPLHCSCYFDPAFKQITK